MPLDLPSSIYLICQQILFFCRKFDRQLLLEISKTRITRYRLLVRYYSRR